MSPILDIFRSRAPTCPRAVGRRVVRSIRLFWFGPAAIRGGAGRRGRGVVCHDRGRGLGHDGLCRQLGQACLLSLSLGLLGLFFYPPAQAAENGRKPPGLGTISFDLKVLFLCHIHIQKHTKTIQIITKTYKSNAKTMQKHEKSKFSRAREARAGFLTFYL